MSEAVRLHTRGPRPQPGTAAASGPPGPWCTAGSGPQAPSPAGAGGCRSLAVVCVPVSGASFPQEPLGPPACRPPARLSGAWTPGRACNPRPSRGPSRAHPRPLEGAPPGPLLGVSLALLAHSPSSGCHPLVQSRDRALGLRGTHVVKLSVFKPRFPCARVTPLRVSCLLSVLPRSSFFMCAPSISSGSLRS